MHEKEKLPAGTRPFRWLTRVPAPGFPSARRLRDWPGTLLLPVLTLAFAATVGRSGRAETLTALLIGLLMAVRMDARRRHAR